MKLLFDFLPIILFFAVFKWSEGNPVEAADFATSHMGFVVSGGVVDATTAPVLLATVVVIAATLGQVAYLLARGRRVEPMLWVSLVLVVGLGAATIWFHSDTFIKWKPTVLYWAMALALLTGRLFWRRNLIQLLLQAQLSLPTPIWWRLNTAWSVFFGAMGLLNLWVAYGFDTATWVNFKLFGGMGLLLAFSVGQALYLNRHLIAPTEGEPEPTSRKEHTP